MGKFGGKMKGGFNKKKTKKIRTNVFSDNNEGTSVADNMILSHLSAKRKEYSVERFENLFKNFDDQLANFNLNKFI